MLTCLWNYDRYYNVWFTKKCGRFFFSCRLCTVSFWSACEKLKEKQEISFFPLFKERLSYVCKTSFEPDNGYKGQTSKSLPSYDKGPIAFTKIELNIQIFYCFISFSPHILVHAWFSLWQWHVGKQTNKNKSVAY